MDTTDRNAGHNHYDEVIKPPGTCPACDKTRYNPRVTSKPGEHLEVTFDIDDDAGDDEHFAAIEAAAREAGLL